MAKDKVSTGMAPYRLLITLLFDSSHEIQHLDGNVKVVSYPYLRLRFPHLKVYKYPETLENLKAAGLIVDYISTKNELAVRFPGIKITPDSKLDLSIPEIVVAHMNRGRR